MPRYRIEHDKDTDDNERFWHWWEVYEDDVMICTCDREGDAKRIVSAMENQKD